MLRERDLRTMIAKAIRQHEAALVRTIVAAVDPLLLAQWHATITQPHKSGATVQSWLWAAPAKHSPRQIEEVLERIELLSGLGVDRPNGTPASQRPAPGVRTACAAADT